VLGDGAGRRRRVLLLILVGWFLAGVVLGVEASRLGGRLVYNDERYIPSDLESIKAARAAAGSGEAVGGPVLVIVLDETRFVQLNRTALLLGSSLGGAGFNVSVSNAATVYWGMLRNYTSLLEEAKEEFNRTLDNLTTVYDGLAFLQNTTGQVLVFADATFGSAEEYLETYCTTGDAGQAYNASFTHTVSYLGVEAARALASALNSTVPGAPNCEAAGVAAENVVLHFVGSLSSIPEEIRGVLESLTLSNYWNKTVIADVAWLRQPYRIS